MSETRRTGFGYYLAATVLIVLVLAAIGFVVAMILRPGVAPPQVLVVTDQAPIACPVAQKGTTCYDTQVTNSGGSEGTFSCRLVPQGDTQATFEDGALIKQVTIGPNQGVHVVSAVTAPGTSPVSAPRVSCAELTS
jgi:hypothetical protein